jgi:hypothetical protein
LTYCWHDDFCFISDSDVCIFELADRNESDDGTVGFRKESAEVGKEEACERPAPASDFQGQIVFFVLSQIVLKYSMLGWVYLSMNNIYDGEGCILALLQIRI